jgi:hypothetical protein
MANEQPTPETYNLRLYRGDTRLWTDTIEENVGTEDAPIWQPKDLTDYEFLAQIRDSRETDAALLATIAVTVVGDPVNGDVEYLLTHDQAKTMPLLTKLEPGWWDLQLTSPTGFVRTHVAGTVTNDGDASHD